jgi:hypothetical protein
MVMWRLKSVFVVLLLLFSQSLSAQDKFINSYKLSFFAGLRDTKVDSFPNTQNLDFMNYLYDFHSGYDYEYIGFSGHFQFRKQFEADFKIAMYDDFAPDNLNFTVQYFFHKNIGANFGIYTHTQLMNGFNTFHLTSDTGFYGDLETNFRQRKLRDRGVQGGIVAKKDFGIFHPVLKINAGFSSFKPFSETVLQKEIDGNFLRRIDYQTKNTWNFFFFPEIALDLDCIKFEKSKLGIQLHANYFFSNKSIDYTQTVFEWTTENPTSESINSPTHKYRKFDFDFGIYLKW